MQTRQSLVLGTAVVVAALILGALFGPRTQAQKTEPAKAEQPAAVGRYQATHVRQDVQVIVVLDTATGHCWENNGGDVWNDLGSPTAPKK